MPYIPVLADRVFPFVRGNRQLFQGTSVSLPPVFESLTLWMALVAGSPM